MYPSVIWLFLVFILCKWRLDQPIGHAKSVLTETGLMAEKKMNGLNIPETEAEVRAEQLSNEFRAGRIMLRIFAAGVLGLAVLFGFVAVQVFRLCVI